MADTSIAGGGSGNTGELTVPTLFQVKTGKVELSTDAGTTYLEYAPGEPIIIEAGVTVHYRNSRPIPAVLHSAAMST
jgi:hypothetical protein